MSALPVSPECAAALAAAAMAAGLMPLAAVGVSASTAAPIFASISSQRAETLSHSSMTYLSAAGTGDAELAHGDFRFGGECREVEVASEPHARHVVADGDRGAPERERGGLEAMPAKAPRAEGEDGASLRSRGRAEPVGERAGDLDVAPVDRDGAELAGPVAAERADDVEVVGHQPVEQLDIDR